MAINLILSGAASLGLLVVGYSALPTPIVVEQAAASAPIAL